MNFNMRGRNRGLDSLSGYGWAFDGEFWGFFSPRCAIHQVVGSKPKFGAYGQRVRNNGAVYLALGGLAPKRHPRWFSLFMDTHLRAICS